ncbi:MAG: hypothetical protein QME07_06560, partial [bacterium]|nr:hypothetical protein [bacterium]
FSYYGVRDVFSRRPRVATLLVILKYETLESVKRQIPLGFLIMSLVILRVCQDRSQHDVRPKTPWYRQKQTPFFS